MRTPVLVSFLSSLAILVLLVAPLTAQTFVVDAAGGAGSQFTSIQTAVAAVPDGSVLLVRAGSYAPFAIVAKGVTVIGEPGAKVVDSVAALVTVLNTATQQRVIVRDLAIENFVTGDSRIECIACAGPVFLQNVTIPPFGPGVAQRLLLDNCDQVLADACGPFRATLGAVAVAVASSELVLVGCNITATGGRAMQATASTVKLVLCSVQGGSVVPTSSLPAVQLLASELWLMRGGALVGSGGVTGPTAAVVGTGSLRWDPAVTVIGPVSVPQSVAPLPSVIGVDGQIGMAASATMEGPAGDLGVLLLGSAGRPFVVPGFVGSFWLDPAATVVLAAGVFGPALTASVNVPMDPSLRGTLFGWQGIAIDPVGAFTVGNVHWFAP
jgi:hypothetical protein